MEKAVRKRKKARDVRKYVGIAKVQERGQYRVVKYRFNYPDKFLEFLQKNFSAVAWVNVFYNTGINTTQRHSTWTNKKGWISY